MMKFRTIKQAIVDVLGAAESGLYQTVGYQRQTINGSEVKGKLRFVQVFYDQGDFPKNTTRSAGPINHDMTFRIHFAASESYTADLTVLNDPDSTDAQRAAAILNKQDAAAKVDDSIDELWEIVFQILMDNSNRYLGLGIGFFDRFMLNGFQKDDVIEQGKLVTLTASAQIFVKAMEEVSGLTPTAATSIDTTTIIEDDPGKAGTENIP